jgi:DNA-binding transcriptional LysR family regulator
MKKAILIVLVFAVLLVTVIPAVSDARGRRYYHRPYYGHHYHGGSGWGLVGAAGSGLVVGTIIGSTMRPAPVYVAPPPPPPPPRVYYYYPPPERVYVYPY